VCVSRTPAAKESGSARPSKADGFGVTAWGTGAGALACVHMIKGVLQIGMALARPGGKVALGGEVSAVAEGQSPRRRG
jgi:hypothetical protein